MKCRMNSLALFLVLLTGLTARAQSCYELVWSDEFNYTGFPDPANWNYEVGGSGWGNNELQYYTRERSNNAYVDKGYLTIRAIRENYNNSQYTSARLITYPLQSWKYGKIEASIKLPYGQGIWPAFWMLGNNIFEGTSWPGSGEIDIMEMIGGGEGRDDVVHGTIHYADANGNHAQYGGSYQLPEGILADTFHVFSVEWTETEIRWYIDGIQYHVADMTPAYLSEFREKFFLLLNVAVGGNWPGSPNAGTVFPQEMHVDYVRVYQRNEEPGLQGDTLVSAGQSGLKFKTVESDDFQYNWTVPDDALILEGQGTHEVSVAWGCEAGTVVCTVIGNCGEYILSRNVSLGEVEITGEEKVEAFSPDNTYHVPEFVNGNYAWTFPADAVLNGTADSNSVNLTWGNTDGYVISNITTNCGTLTDSILVTSVLQLPYPDPRTRHSLPGTIESVYYDTGGEGFSYHDIDEENVGPGIRQDEGVDTELNDGGGTVGWIRNGEWIEYSIDVQTEGLYRAELRVASQAGGGNMQILVNGEDRSGNISIPSTFSWTAFTTIIEEDIQFYETDSLIRLVFNVGEFNLGRMTFVTKGTNVDSSKPNGITLYPNPVSDHIRLNKQANSYHYFISDVSGKIYQSGTVDPDQAIQVRTLPPGVYFIKFKNAEEKINLKFIKN